MCAAPGGKTFTLSYLSDDSAHINAFDLHEHKVKNLMEDCKRLGIKSIRCSTKDSSVFDPSLISSADKILCDVPCSGLGMIFSKPDIKYNTVDFESLTGVQYKILSNAAQYLKKGGTLVYSTCTINSSENEDVVKRLISDNQEIYLSENTYIYNTIGGEYTFLPHVDNTDGFYIAVLKKR
jgi:16S rRNA (cytosine967-C5)-methyltransferase